MYLALSDQVTWVSSARLRNAEPCHAVASCLRMHAERLRTNLRMRHGLAARNFVSEVPVENNNLQIESIVIATMILT